MANFLLLLRTPPPYGGGELQQEILRDHYAGKDGYRIIELSASRRDKTNQGAFAVWKIAEFAQLWLHVFIALLTSRPKLLCMVMGKGFPHFLRDSLLVWPAWLLRIPVAVELHGIDFYFLSKRGLRAWYGRLMLNRIRSIRVLGESIRRRLQDHGVQNTFVLENGVSTGSRKEHVQEGDQREVNLLFVGTLSHAKGFDVLVEAGRIMKMAGVPFQVQAMGQWGSSQFEAEVVEQISRHGLETQFILHGLKHGEEKWRQFAACQVLVLPSLNEGQPLVILEGLSYGMAIVASDVGAIPDTVENEKNGYLVPPRDAERLAYALSSLISDRKRLARIAKENQELFEQRFTLERMLRNHRQWLELCREADRAPRGEDIAPLEAIGEPLE